MNNSKAKETKQRFKTMEQFLNERTRRLFADNVALVVGLGSIISLGKLTRLTIMLRIQAL